MAGKRDTSEIDPAVPVSSLKRGAVIGTTVAKVGAKKVAFLATKKQKEARAKAEQKVAHDEEVARVIFAGLTKLRGSAMKIAQLLSLESGILPEQYRQELAKSYYQVPPLNRAIVRKVFMTEFGKPPEDLFAQFDDEAFAAASLGQVHKAKSVDGRQLAVKVQYPGIAAAVENDVRLVRRLVIPRLRPKFIGRMLDEIEVRLQEELNYASELENLLWFKENLNFDDVVVPEVFPEFSGRRLLTMSLAEGQHLDPWLDTNPSQESKNHAAQRLYDLFMYCTFELRTLHADPNPGNYLFHDSGTISLIDFGCVKRYSKKQANILAKLWIAHAEDNHSEIAELCKPVGLNTDDSGTTWQSIYEEFFKPFNEWLARPIQQELFDFAKHKGFCARGTEIFRRALLDKRFDNFTVNYIFFDRTLLGLYRIFERMGAKLCLRPKWMR